MNNLENLVENSNELAEAVDASPAQPIIFPANTNLLLCDAWPSERQLGELEEIAIRARRSVHLC